MYVTLNISLYPVFLTYIDARTQGFRMEDTRLGYIQAISRGRERKARGVHSDRKIRVL